MAKHFNENSMADRFMFYRLTGIKLNENDQFVGQKMISYNTDEEPERDWFEESQVFKRSGLIGSPTGIQSK